MVVIDASAVVDLILERPAASAIAKRISDEALHAPALIDVEFAHCLRRLNASRALTDRRGEEALADFADLAVERHGHEIFLSRIWELRKSLTAYDAAYIALAEALDAPLLTLDRRLSQSHGHGAVVEVVESTQLE